MLIRDRMSRKIISVSPRETVERAAALLRRHGVRHLPVVRAARLVGIVSDRDLRGRGLSHQAVADVMAARPVSIAPDASVDEAARVMRAHRISSLPVVEGSRLVGILTTTDVLDAFVDLSGVAEATTRIILTCKGGRNARRQIHEIVHGCHGELKWFHQHGRQLHLRVKNGRVNDTVTALEGAGFDVTAVVASKAALR